MVLPIAMQASSQEANNEINPTFFTPGDILSKQEETFLDSFMHTAAGERINEPRFSISTYSIPIKAGILPECNTPRS